MADEIRTMNMYGDESSNKVNVGRRLNVDFCN